MIVIDSSAILALLGDEPGGDDVRVAFEGTTLVCSAANWSETAQKLLAKGRKWSHARALLFALGLQIEPVTREDAEWASQHWLSHSDLSLGDRLCLALANRLGCDAWTADPAWGDGPGVHQIR